MKFRLIACLGLAASGLLLAQSSYATEGFENTAVTLGWTNSAKADPVFGTGTSDQNQVGLRLEHFGVHEYGDNYFFVDTLNGNQVGGAGSGSFNFDTKNQYLLIWMPRLSLSKVFGKKLTVVPLEDVSLMYRMERESYANYDANMIGPSFNFKVPGFDLLQTSFLYNKQNFSFANSDDRAGHLFWHTVAIVPFQVGGVKFTFSPLMWMNSGKGGAGTETYIEPDLWMKLGNSPFELGFRDAYHKYQNFSRTTPTLLARWNFLRYWPNLGQYFAI